MKLCAFLFLFVLTGFAISASSAFKAPEKDFYFKELEKRQEGDCTEQEVEDFLENDKDAQACNRTLTADCSNNPSTCKVYEVLCTGVCEKAYFKLFKKCNDTALEQTYRATCGKAPSGDRCGDDILSTGVLGELSFACPPIATDCSGDCKQSIEDAKDTSGCCLNNLLNDTVVADYSCLSTFNYLVSDDLWSECGVPTDIGFCYGSAYIIWSFEPDSLKNRFLLVCPRYKRNSSTTVL